MTKAEMKVLTQGLKSTSEKIRRLHAAGVATADIAEFLEIRYQFAYNVIKNAKPALSEASPADNGGGPTLEDLIRVAHAKGFAVTFHPLKGA